MSIEQFIGHGSMDSVFRLFSTLGQRPPIGSVWFENNQSLWIIKNTGIHIPEEIPGSNHLKRDMSL